MIDTLPTGSRENTPLAPWVAPPTRTSGRYQWWRGVYGYVAE